MMIQEIEGRNFLHFLHLLLIISRLATKKVAPEVAPEAIFLRCLTIFPDFVRDVGTKSPHVTDSLSAIGGLFKFDVFSAGH